MRLIRWTTDYLAGKGVDTPRLDAEVLLADLLAMDRVRLYMNYDRPLQPEELAGYRSRVRRRAAREPVAYITGKREFYSLELEVGPGVLVPRPETELLVEETVRLAGERWPGLSELRLADLGTGSGAVALALASLLPQARIWAVDLSPDALHYARRNAARHNPDGRISLFLGDLLEPLSGQQPFHLITANLPYVPEPALADMAPDVRDYEPVLSLGGGADGLDIILRAVEQARPRLADGGALLLEVWPDHGLALQGLASGLGYGDVRIIRDLAGRDRVVVLDTLKKEE